jgi:hypothetical protein
MPGCKHNGVEYSEGSLLCMNGREVKCSGGSWSETGYRCVTGSEDLSVYSVEEASIGKDEVRPFLPCVQAVGGPPPGHFSVYNSCDKCVRVVLDWAVGGIQEVNVPPNTRADIRTKSSSMRIIAEKDC